MGISLNNRYTQKEHRPLDFIRWSFYFIIINRAHQYIYLTNDVPFIQDGTRLDETDRDLLDVSHRNTLSHFSREYDEIGGSYDERLQKAIALIDRELEG